MCILKLFKNYNQKNIKKLLNESLNISIILKNFNAQIANFIKFLNIFLIEKKIIFITYDILHFILLFK